MAEWKQGVRQDAPFQDQIRRVARIRCFRCQAFNLLVDVYATANGPEKPCAASEIEHQLKVFEVLGHGAQHVGQNCLWPFKSSILEFLEGWMLSRCLGGQLLRRVARRKPLPNRMHL
jgi:hypothetical protein